MGIRDFAAPEGESWKDVNSRARNFIQTEIVAKFFRNKNHEESKSPFEQNIHEIKPKNLQILVVSHGGFIMEFVNAIKYFQSPETHEDKFKNNTKNTSITIFRLTQDLSDKADRIKYDITLQNDNSHLEMTIPRLNQKYRKKALGSQVQSMSNKFGAFSLNQPVIKMKD